ncbi:pyrroline-5-carboxylate reductase [Thermoactinomyces mirandus]|uniref:Pyrroline-5-carboxylate reductase n=1 Tax=Thermoactinomyces mirandus TaxID=2756294 RepID=A0A7W1XQ03_9BACL|nr:pyrroline-5-carboxylate reductase [Thermoactinomyces mirandus]MBA4601081.1 pyrroline-5-carboxylate reductase [Thermoactinomyces mirandus]
MLKNKTIGFIGAGSMAEAILKGLLSKNMVNPENVFLINRKDQSRLSEISQKYGLILGRQKAEYIAGADIIILAVKPKDVTEVLQRWGNRLQDGQIFISVVAGISTELLENYIQNRVSVVRVMPNTSCAVGLSATAISGGKRATNRAIDVTCEIFSSIGSVVLVNESMMDTVTGLSGSGPAYIYYMVEALESAGVSAGLHPQTARLLTVQTLLGAAQMLLKTGKDASELRKEVTSPGGTTMAGLKALKEYQVAEAMKVAVFKAKERANELGKQLASL